MRFQGQPIAPRRVGAQPQRNPARADTSPPMCVTPTPVSVIISQTIETCCVSVYRAPGYTYLPPSAIMGRLGPPLVLQ